MRMTFQRRLPYPVFDADHHLYETEEAFTKYLPEKYRGVIQYVEINKRKKIVVRGTISEFIPNPTFEVIAAPGAHEDYFKHGNPKGLSMREITGKPIRCPQEFREPVSRLAQLDQQGIDRTLMFPTLASLIEERMRDDPDTTHEVIHALNQWLHETWSFNYKDRIFTTPVISLAVVDKAVKELEWALERGARCVLIRPAPVPGYRHSRSFAYPEFDPFWRIMEAEGILVGMHSSDSGYARYTSEWTGPTEMLPFKHDPFRHMSALSRPIEDSCAAMVSHGMLTRFPKLNVAMIENGGAWVSNLFRQMKLVWKKMPQHFEMDPIELFKRQIYVAPFFEDDLGELINNIGAEHVLFGSDFPHPEGLRDPVTFPDHLPPGLPQADVAKIMGGNLGRLMGTDKMTAVAAE